MSGAPTTSTAPRWSALRILAGGIFGGVALQFLSGQPVEDWNLPLVSAPGFWKGWGCSLIVLIIALPLSACLGLAAEVLSRDWGTPLRRMIALCGRATALLPAPALAWGFVGWWIGFEGGSVETLMPAELPAAVGNWQTAAARSAWQFLAPALLLAIPLAGEMMHRLIAEAPATPAFDLALRARGVPAADRLWRHHLPQLLPVAATRLQALCLIAPVYLVVIEDVLRFMGWGGRLAHALREADVQVIAMGMLSGGGMVALLMGVIGLITRRSHPPAEKLGGLSWQPWLLWALAFMAVKPAALSPWLVLWFAVILARAADWHRAWRDVERHLPLDAARALGGSAMSLWWRHVARVQARFLVAWIAAAFARTLAWITIACCLRPDWVEDLSPSLARWMRPLAIATSRDAAAVLADPLPLLQAGGVIALASLCLIQVSRIIQPRAT